MVSSWVSKSCFKVAAELLKSPEKDWSMQKREAKGRHKAASSKKTQQIELNLITIWHFTAKCSCTHKHKRPESTRDALFCSTCWVFDSDSRFHLNFWSIFGPTNPTKCNDTSPILMFVELKVDRKAETKQQVPKSCSIHQCKIGERNILICEFRPIFTSTHTKRSGF